MAHGQSNVFLSMASCFGLDLAVNYVDDEDKDDQTMMAINE